MRLPLLAAAGDAGARRVGRADGVVAEIVVAAVETEIEAVAAAVAGTETPTLLAALSGDGQGQVSASHGNRIGLQSLAVAPAHSSHLAAATLAAHVVQAPLAQDLPPAARGLRWRAWLR
jgi:hypothetical protein